MAITPVPPITEIPIPKTPEQIATNFTIWLKGRTGLTTEEFVNNYADTHKLTPEERLTLLASSIPPTPPTTPTTPTPTPPILPPTKPTVEKDLIIKRTKYPKWWNDEGVAKINLTSPGSQLVITARGDYSLYIAAIVLTVSGECDIVFTFGSGGPSGSMNFGGSDEPRGIVIAMGNSPAPCGSGTFMITAESDDPVSIGGFVSYFLWKKET